MSTRAAAVSAAFAFVTLALGACSGASPTPAAQGAGSGKPDLDPIAESATTAIDEQRCVEGIRNRPFVVSWDATEQAELASLAQESLAVVKLQGCKLELLPSCRLPGEYRLRETSGNLQSLSIRSSDDLYAELPLAVASLSGRLQKSGSLELGYFVKGTRTATAPELYRSQLGPGCAGATHFVLNFAAGAYRLASTKASSASASAQTLGVGAGAARSSSAEALFVGGDIEQCQRSGARCDAPVRLRLSPIIEGAPRGAEAEVAKLAVTKPVAPATPQPLSSDDQMKWAGAVKASLNRSLVACLTDHGADWSKGDRGSLKLSVMFGQDGSPTNVKVDADPALRAEGVDCALYALWTARYPATGGPKENIAGMMSWKLTVQKPTCLPGTRVDGLRCLPLTGKQCPATMTYSADAGCWCKDGQQWVEGKGCSP